LLVTRPRDPNVIARRAAREAARLAAAQFVASRKQAPAPPDDPKGDAGGKPHA
jgi:hypothetical protein